MQYYRTEDIIRYTTEKARSSEEDLQPVETDGRFVIFMLPVKNRLFATVRWMGNLYPRDCIAPPQSIPKKMLN